MNCKKAVVDRIEGDRAVCELENRETIDVKVGFFNYPVQPGDYVQICRHYACKDEKRQVETIKLEDYFKE